MSTTSRTVSFRIGPDHFERLEETAAAENRTPGDFARIRLLESLDGDGGRAELMERLTRMERALTAEGESPGLSERLTRIERLLTDLHHDLPLTARALFIAGGLREPITPETALKWAQENLKTQD